METYFNILLFVILVIILTVFRLTMIRRQNKKLNTKKFNTIQSLHESILDDSPDKLNTIKQYAEDPVTRELTFELLKEKKRIELFPSEYLDFIKSSESFLINWLMYPTELGKQPDELLYHDRVSIHHEKIYHYEVFNFKMHAPHDLAEKNWMWGIVGPFYNESEPYDFPIATFSRFISASENSAEDEVKWVHEHIYKK